MVNSQAYWLCMVHIVNWLITEKINIMVNWLVTNSGMYDDLIIPSSPDLAFMMLHPAASRRRHLAWFVAKSRFGLWD